MASLAVDSVAGGGDTGPTSSDDAAESPPGGDRSKRRRRAPAVFKNDGFDMDNEQLRLLQVAVENSRAENVAADVHIDEAPTFHPTVEEFQDPIKYISR